MIRDQDVIRRVAVLWNGDATQHRVQDRPAGVVEEHVDPLGAQLAQLGGDVVGLVVDGAVEGGLTRDRVHYFEQSDAAAPVIARDVRDGDVVLVKGSRGTRTDLVADAIVRERS